MREHRHLLAHAPHERWRARQADGHVGAERGRNAEPVDAIGERGVGAGHRAQQRARVGRAATEAGRDRQTLVKGHGAERQARRNVGKTRKRRRDKVLTGDGSAERPADAYTKRRACLQQQLVAHVGEIR